MKISSRSILLTASMMCLALAGCGSSAQETTESTATASPSSSASWEPYPSWSPENQVEDSQPYIPAAGGESASSSDPFVAYREIMCGTSVLPSEEDIKNLSTLSESQKQDTIAWIQNAPAEVIAKSKQNAGGAASSAVATTPDEKCSS